VNPLAITQPQPSITSALIAGAVTGFLVIFAIVSTALLIAGAGTTTSLGFALFVAAFGGPGFGTMFGANWYVHRFGEPL
jgi:hypothetical protein